MFIFVKTKLKLVTVVLSSKIKSLRFASETLSVISLRFSADVSMFFNEFSIELELFEIIELKLSVVSYKDSEIFLKLSMLSCNEFLVSLLSKSLILSITLSAFCMALSSLNCNGVSF